MVRWLHCRGSLAIVWCGVESCTCRFGDTAANVAVLELLAGSPLPLYLQVVPTL